MQCVKTTSKSVHRNAIVSRKEDISLLNINGAEDALGEFLSIYKIQYTPKPGYERGLITMSTGGQRESVEFVWLAMSRSRILWAEYDPKVNISDPLCKSIDGITPHSGLTMRSGMCAECQDSRWQNNKPPLCAEIFNMLCWDFQYKSPFVFAVKRTGIKSLKMLKTKIKRNTENSKIPIHLKLIIKLHVKPEGQYFIPEFSIVKKSGFEESQEYYRVAKKFIEMFQETTDPEESS